MKRYPTWLVTREVKIKPITENFICNSMAEIKILTKENVSRDVNGRGKSACASETAAVIWGRTWHYPVK